MVFFEVKSWHSHLSRTGSVATGLIDPRIHANKHFTNFLSDLGFCFLPLPLGDGRGEGLRRFTPLFFYFMCESEAKIRLPLTANLSLTPPWQAP